MYSANFNNGALPSQVWPKCADCFLGDNGLAFWNGNTLTLSPVLYATDQSTPGRHHV